MNGISKNSKSRNSYPHCNVFKRKTIRSTLHVLKLKLAFRIDQKNDIFATNNFAVDTIALIHKMDENAIP